MFTQEGFDAFAAALAQRNNLPLAEAEKYAALIGDTPELTEDGRCCVRDDSGRVLAIVNLPGDDSE